MRELLRGLLDLVLPHACGGCGGALAQNAPLCPRCTARLCHLRHDGCPRCQGPTPLPGAPCAGCARRRVPPTACVAEVAFAGDGAEWLRRFKYPRGGLKGLDPAASAVASWLARQAARRLPPPAPGLVVPVPLHPRRLRQRGFHPAAELAWAVAREMGTHVDPTALVRLRDTASQTGLDHRARRRNVAGAFRAQRSLRGIACVCLVDDVVTTGSTIREAARALRRAGARRVVAACAARTPAPQ